MSTEAIAHVRLLRDERSGSYTVMVEQDGVIEASAGWTTVSAAFQRAAEMVCAELSKRPAAPELLHPKAWVP